MRLIAAVLPSVLSAERPEASSAGQYRTQQHSVHANADLKGNAMKITVLGASGLIGSKLVNLLRQQGYDVVLHKPGLC